MFSSNDSECFRNLESIDNLSLLDTTSVTNMSNMFLWCSSLSNFDLSAFNTSNVENMQGMFNFCEITTLDHSNFDTSSVVNMSSMFATLMQLTWVIRILNIIVASTSRVSTRQMLPICRICSTVVPACQPFTYLINGI